MHAVHVGIGSHDDLVVAQSVEPVLDVERGLQEVELLIFVDHLFGQSEAVERLAAQREHGLRAHVAAFGDRAAGGVALGDEDGGVEARVALVVFLFPTLALGFGRGVVEVDAAVAQFAVVEVGLLGTLARQFRNAGNGLALRLAFLYLLADHFCHVEMLVEEVVYVFFDKIAHKLIHAHAREGEGIAVAVLVGRHGERAEFDFRLALKHRLYHAYGDCRYETVAHVLHVEILVEIFLDGAGDMLLEGTLVRAALGGVLPVHERVIFLAILRRVGEGYVDALAFEVHYGVKPGGGHIVGEQVFEAVAADDAAAVVVDGEPRVEVGVVAEHRLHKLAAEAEVAEEFRVGLEIDVRTVFLLRVFVHVAHEHAALKGGLMHLAVAVGAGDELAAQGVHGFQTHAVQTYAGGEHGGVVLRARVEFRHGVDEAAQGNAAPVVADRGRLALLHVHLDALAEAFVELVDAVVDAFFQEHVDTVLGVRAVAETADIHTGARADMVGIFKMPDFAFVVNYGIGHGIWNELTAKYVFHEMLFCPRIILFLPTPRIIFAHESHESSRIFINE